MNHIFRSETMKIVRRVCATAALAVFVVISSSAQQSPPVARLTLRRAIELAVQNSRDIAQARFQQTLADRHTAVDRSSFLPNLSTGSGAQYTSGFPLAPGGGVPAVFILNYRQDIYDPLQRSFVRADRERTRGLESGVDAARDAAMLRAASAYLELSKVRHSLEYLRKDRESTQKLIDTMRQRIASGFELPIEETRAQLSSARVEQQIVHNEGREAVLEDQLRDMLGLVSDQPLDLADETLTPPADQSVSDMVAQAIQNDPGIKQAEAERRAKEQIVKGAEGNRWPTLALVGTYSVLTKANNYTEFFNKFERNNLNFGVQAQIPIYGPHANAAVLEARADLSTAEIDVRNKRIQVEQQVKAQAHLVREMEASRDVAQWDLKLAQQNQGVVQAQFDQGRATLKELGQAQLDENDKWLAFLDADFQRQQAQLTLLQMTGQIAKVLQ